MTDPDFAAEMAEDAREAEEQAGESQGDAIAKLAERALATKDRIDELDRELKREKKALEELAQRKIPAALNQIGVPELTVMCGNRRVRITLDNKVFGSLNNAPDPDRALTLLDGAGFEGAFLTQATVDLEQDELHMLEKLQDVAHEFFGKDVNVTREINSSTLRAFVRRIMEDHPDFDPKSVGCTVVREAKFHVK